MLDDRPFHGRFKLVTILLFGLLAANAGAVWLQALVVSNGLQKAANSVAMADTVFRLDHLLALMADRPRDAAAAAPGAPFDPAAMAAAPADRAALADALQEFGGGSADEFIRRVRQARAASDAGYHASAAVRHLSRRRAWVMLLVTCNLALAFTVVWGAALHTFRSAQKEAARNLARARGLVRQSEQGRADLLALAGHDLRQPLHAISLFAAIIARRSDDPEIARIAGNIGVATVSMQSMIEGLLDMAKLDAGLVVADLVPLDLSECFRTLDNEFSARAGAKGLGLDVPAEGVTVLTDPLLLQSILRNLVGNAITYTAQGGVSVSLSCEADRVRVSVEDTGIGIPEEQLGLIFDDFYRAHAAGDGLGLGLGIVRRLAGLLGTRVEPRSVVGVGSCFTVTLPRTDRPPVPAGTADGSW